MVLKLKTKLKRQSKKVTEKRAETRELESAHSPKPSQINKQTIIQKMAKALPFRRNAIIPHYLALEIIFRQALKRFSEY